MRSIEIERISNSDTVPDTIKSLYESSFPFDERRPWEATRCLINQADETYNFMIIKQSGRPIGMAVIWRFELFDYCEYLAVVHSKRGVGIGSKVLKLLLAKRKTPLVLEVEPPSQDPMTIRRIEFYKRNGFTLHEAFEYRQPPYHAEGKPLRLMLMTNGPEIDLDAVTAIIHKNVYNKSDPDIAEAVTNN